MDLCKLRNISLTLLVLINSSGLFAQTIKKQLNAVRISEPLRIDGMLDETVWQNAPAATDFIQNEPYNGKPAGQKSEVRFLYDDDALYVGAILYDSAPDSIFMELSKRDAGEVNADHFAVNINPYNDGLNSFSFMVSASGVQTDIKYSPSNIQSGREAWHPRGMDKNWDAVWHSKVRITDTGWVVEMKIPYSAIRFPKQETQIWGLNIWRGIRRFREKSTWNFVDKEIDGIENQSGELHGINNIKPPLRLSFTPYVSGYIEKNPENENLSTYLNGGLDLKYGLNESFTLDITVIPDFGQVQSDDIILNLSPYEIKYDEKRSFFTEGTELYNKCDIFYSRRIGDTPNGYYDVEDYLAGDEEIIENPVEAQLINATKISGRTRKGLGIGIFDAMTAGTYAVIRDSLGNENKFTTQPFTNYNLIVFDQSLKNNSYISLINTNVNRYKDKYTANVSGTEFKIANKKNMYAITGKGAVSKIFNNSSKPDLGYKYDLEAGKISGNFLYKISRSVLSDTYDPNDMGYLRRNNEMQNKLSVNYNIYDPVWKFIWWRNGITILHSSLYYPDKFSELKISMNSTATFRNYFTLGIRSEFRPVDMKDYYESRLTDRVFIDPSYFMIEPWVSSDYRKTFAYDIRVGYLIADDHNKRDFWYELKPRVRISDKFMIIHKFEPEYKFNDIGFVFYDTDSNNVTKVTFGKRDIFEVSNIFTASYIFNANSSLSLRLRHYWSKAEYNDFYILNEEGYLDGTDYSDNHDINFNAFNIDMNYTWQFAPGSEISILWKNSIYTDSNSIVENFFTNIENTLESPQINSISAKILYYLDYRYFKKKPHSE